MPKLRHRVQLRPQIKNLWRALAQITIGKRCWPQLSPSKISSVETESQTGCGILAQVAEHQEAQPILHYLVPRHSRNQFSFFFCFLLPRAFLPCQFIRRFWMSQPQNSMWYIHIYSIYIKYSYSCRLVLMLALSAFQHRRRHQRSTFCHAVTEIWATRARYMSRRIFNLRIHLKVADKKFYQTKNFCSWRFYSTLEK